MAAGGLSIRGIDNGPLLLPASVAKVVVAECTDALLEGFKNNVAALGRGCLDDVLWQTVVASARKPAPIIRAIEDALARAGMSEVRSTALELEAQFYRCSAQILDPHMEMTVTTLLAALHGAAVDRRSAILARMMQMYGDNAVEAFDVDARCLTVWYRMRLSLLISTAQLAAKAEHAVALAVAAFPPLISVPQAVEPAWHLDTPLVTPQRFVDDAAALRRELPPLPRRRRGAIDAAAGPDTSASLGLILHEMLVRAASSSSSRFADLPLEVQLATCHDHVHPTLHPQDSATFASAAGNYIKMARELLPTTPRDEARVRYLLMLCAHDPPAAFVRMADIATSLEVRWSGIIDDTRPTSTQQLTLSYASVSLWADLVRLLSIGVAAENAAIYSPDGTSEITFDASAFNMHMEWSFYNIR